MENIVEQIKAFDAECAKAADFFKQNGMLVSPAAIHESTRELAEACGAKFDTQHNGSYGNGPFYCMVMPGKTLLFVKGTYAQEATNA